MQKVKVMFKFILLLSFYPLSGFASEEERIQQVAVEYEKNKQGISKESLHSLDTFKLMEQRVVEEKNQKKFSRLIKLKGLEVNIHKKLGNQQTHLLESNMVSISNGDITKITLSFQGRTFHEFNLKANQVLTYDQKIFFKNRQGLFFIDLSAHKQSLAVSEIPIFRLPVAKEILGKTISAGKQGFRIGEVKITKEVVKIYSEAQRIAFNITANLVDPKFHGDSLPVIESFKEYFKLTLEKTGQSLKGQAQSVQEFSKKIIEMQDVIKQDLLRQQKMALASGEITEEKRQELLKKVSHQAVNRLEKDLLAGKELTEKYERVTANTLSSRKLTTRLHWIWARMSMPTPNGSRRIKESLQFVQKTLVFEKLKNINTTFQSMDQLRKNGSLLFGAGVTTYFGMVYQVELASFLYQSLDTTRVVLNTVFGEMETLKNMGYTAKEAAKSTINSFNPFTIKEAYFSSDILPKLGVGLTAMVSSLYIIIGTPHIIVNSVKLYKDLKKQHFQKFYETAMKQGKSASRARFSAYIQTYFSRENFIQRQKDQNKQYLDLLASAHTKGQTSEFSAEESKEVEKIIAQLELQEKQNRGFVRRFVSKVNIIKFIKRKGQASETSKTKEITNFPQALKNFLFSYASFTNTGYIYTNIWNKWFVIRSFALRPSTWYTFLAYPNYYEKIVRPVSTEIVMPTKFNGGIQTRWSKLFSTMDKKKLNAWENKVFVIEEKVHNYAIRKAFVALSAHIKSDQQLKELLEHGAIKSIFDQRVAQLKKKQQIYFQNVFQLLFNNSMEEILKKSQVVTKGEKFDVRMVNNLSFEQIEKLDQIKDVDRFVEKVWSENKLDYVEQAKKKVSDAFIRPSLRTLRNSTATARVKSTNKHGNNPLRMAQAVRYMIAKNLVDKPMELMFMFVGLAAIQTSGLGQDLIRPVQEAMFSENSWFYLSRYSFLNGYLTGVVMGVMADVWYKLQIGEMHKQDTGEVPTGENAKKSFFRWYLQKANTAENSWWGNQKHYVKLIYANMPAAIVTYMTINFVTLGRFDIDSYLIGYLAAYLLPTSGLNFKLENGFELSSGYFLKDIPKKFHSHPLVQEYSASLAHNKRLAFNLFYTTYENILSTFLFTMNSMETEKMGTRSLTRSIFGGWTVTEKIADSAENLKVNLAVSNIPGKNGLIKAVDLLCHPLTNNFTDWSKFKPKP